MKKGWNLSRLMEHYEIMIEIEKEENYTRVKLFARYSDSLLAIVWF